LLFVSGALSVVCWLCVFSITATEQIKHPFLTTPIFDEALTDKAAAVGK
jgi:hypothetical protein